MLAPIDHYECRRGTRDARERHRGIRTHPGAAAGADDARKMPRSSSRRAVSGARRARSGARTPCRSSRSKGWRTCCRRSWRTSSHVRVNTMNPGRLAPRCGCRRIRRRIRKACRCRRPRRALRRPARPREPGHHRSAIRRAGCASGLGNPQRLLKIKSLCAERGRSRRVQGVLQAFISFRLRCSDARRRARRGTPGRGMRSRRAA